MNLQDHDQKRLFRDARHKKIGGVCAGIANYFNTQRLYIRIAAIIILCLNPLAVVAGYGLAYFLLEEGETEFYEDSDQLFEE